MRSPGANRWRALRPITRAVAVFVPLACFGLNFALPRLPWQPQITTSLDYSVAWLEGIAHYDSWRPMRMALAYLDDLDIGSIEDDDTGAPPARDESAGSAQLRGKGKKGERLLYQELFFERGVKLQYPPTSLLALDGLRRLPFAGFFPDGDPLSDRSLNRISWLAVLCCALLSALCFVLCAGMALAPGDPPLKRSDRVLLGLLGAVAGIAFYPLVRGFYLGQIQTVIDALLAGLVLAWVVRRQATAGVLAGLICLIKPQLGFLVLWALLRRRFRFVAGFTVVVGIAGCASLAAYGLGTHLDYLEVLSFIGRHGEGFHPNQSLNGLLNRMLEIGNNLEWEGEFFAPFDARVYWPTLLCSMVLLGFALLYRAREHERAPALDLAIAIVSVTLASPVAWTHHYAVLLPVFAVAVPATFSTTTLGRSRFLWLGLSYVFVANNFRALNRLADTPFNFLQSYVFFAGLALLFLLYRLRRAASESGETKASPG